MSANESAEARLREDARRYRRLQILGCAPYGTQHLLDGDVMRFTNLDVYVDSDIERHPSRGEALSAGGDEAKKYEGGSFQSRVRPWMMACFGAEISADRVERNHRFLEEALELVQSTGCTPDDAHQLVDYVYGRPQGEINQEVGGVMVTLAALCLANGIDMHQGGETELARVWTKVDKIRAKQAAKPKHSPLPGPSDPTVILTGALAKDVAAAAKRVDEWKSSDPPDRREIVARIIDPDAYEPINEARWEGLARLESQAEAQLSAERKAGKILASLDGGSDA